MKFQQLLAILCISLVIVMVVKLPNKEIDILTCNRSLQGCQVKRFRWDGEKQVFISINDLREAGVEKRKNKNQNRVTYLLILYTDNENYTVSYNGTISEKQKIADRANNFIANPNDVGFSEKIEQTNWGKWIFAGIITLLCIKGIVNKKN